MQSESTNVTAILEQLLSIGARLSFEGEVLRCHLSQGQLPENLAQQIRAAKPALLKYLGTARRPKLPEVLNSQHQGESPLSSAQMRIWLHEQLHQDNLFFEIPFAVRLRGQLDPDAMRRAWQDVCRRHPLLRARLATSAGMPSQRIGSEAVVLEVYDWSRNGPISSERLTNDLRKIASQARQMRGDALVAPSLYILGEKDFALLLCFHHAVVDGWSLGVILAELMELHSTAMHGKPSRLQEPGASYFDYVAWQREYLASPAFEYDLAYWTRTLADLPLPLSIGTPRDESNTGGSRTCARSIRNPSPAFPGQAAAWSRAHDGSLYSFMLTSWAVLLYAYSGRNDFIVGSVSAARPSADLEGVVGCFINTLPVRLKVYGRQSFAEVHVAVNEALMGALEHQQCPVDRIVEAVNPQRSKGTPLFCNALLLQNFPRPDAATSGLDSELLDVALDGLGLELRVVGADVNGEFRLVLEYDAHLINSEAADRLLANYLQVMELALESAETTAAAFRLRLQWCEQIPRTQKYCVAATFTADPVAEAFDYWVKELALPLDIEFAPWSQIVPQLLDPSSLLRSESDLACVLLRLEDWLLDPAADVAVFESRVAGFIEACHAFAANVPTPISIWICPSAETEFGEARGLIDRAEAAICESMLKVSRIRVVKRAESRELISIPAEELSVGVGGPVPYSPRAYTALGTLLARDAAAHLRPPLKAVVLDADNTLWSGLCAEDGPEGVRLDEPAKALQRFFLELRRQGVVLCLCSKNVEEDVRKVFEHGPEMPMCWDDFSIRRVNWEAKSANISALAHSLNIGLDAMIFVDDSPAETAEVEANCPEIRCVTLPQPRSEIPAFLRGIWDFDVRDTSGEGARRLQAYALTDAREQVRHTSAGIEEYVAALQVQVTLRPMAPGELERVSELTRRTNQFNFSGRRRTPTELSDWLAQAGHGAMVIDVRDRFGDYGLTGALLHFRRRDVAVVESFLLSCRVLGRRVEHAVLSQLRVSMAREGLRRIEFEFAPTSRNEPAANFAVEYLGLPRTVHTAVWTCAVELESTLTKAL